MYKFIKEDDYDSSKIVHTSYELTWSKLLINFMYFLKGCGYVVTKSALSEFVDDLEQEGCLSEEVETPTVFTDLDTKILAEQARYDRQYTDLKDLELDIDVEHLELIEAKAKELNVSQDAVISTILQEYVNNE